MRKGVIINTRIIARAGVIAALYVILSLITFPIASGTIQFRISEGLMLLCLIFPESVISLTIGCLISNLITGCMILDVFLGSAITLISCIFTYLIGRVISKKWLKIFLGGIFPVVLNAFLLPIIWYFAYGKLEYVYIVQVSLLILSQTLSVYCIGTPLYFGTLKLKEKGLI